MILSKEELGLLYEDQWSAIESVHLGDRAECGDYRDCPADHFDEDIYELVKIRQGLIYKLTEIAQEEL